MILWGAVSVNATSEGPLRVGRRVPLNRVTASFMRIVIDLVRLGLYIRFFFAGKPQFRVEYEKSVGKQDGVSQ
jgi:hypothetical protein